MPMLELQADRCTGCGLCVADCPRKILELQEGRPVLAPEREASCFRCLHCFAVCPGGAISIHGNHPEASRPLAGSFPDPEALETLVQGRRSVRRYRDENLDPALVQRLLDVAIQAPTAVNARSVRFTVIDDREVMAAFRGEVMAALGRMVREGRLPETHAMYGDFVRLWEEEGVDVLFRGAPHLLVASAAADAPAPLVDGFIALATFDLLAQAHGVGTVWDGLAKRAFVELLPETRVRLGLPEDHVLVYAMAFGPAAVRYARTVHHPADIHRVGTAGAGLP